MRIDVNGELKCSNCSGNFLMITQYPDLCNNCFCPHGSIGNYDEILYCKEEFWPDIAAQIAELLEKTIPKLTVEDVSKISARHRQVMDCLKNVEGRGKCIVV